MNPQEDFKVAWHACDCGMAMAQLLDLLNAAEKDMTRQQHTKSIHKMKKALAVLTARYEQHVKDTTHYKRLLTEQTCKTMALSVDPDTQTGQQQLQVYPWTKDRWTPSQRQKKK